MAVPSNGRPSSFTFPLILFAIVTCFYWKLVFTYQFDWMWSPDLADQILPWWQEEARQLQHGWFPLWDPHNWMGQPLLGQAQPGAAYPLNWLLWLTPLQHGLLQMWAINWYFVVVHYMAALFGYLLCRDLGRSRAASMLAGLAFSLAGYVGWIDWPQMLNGVLWTPLVFLFLLRAVRGVHPWASAALSGACIGMAWLSGHHQAPIFLTLAAGGVWLYYILKGRRPDWRMAQLAGVAMVFAPVVGALQILPAAEFGRLAWRWVGARDHLGWNDPVPYYVQAQHAIPPIRLFGILIPGYGDNADPFLGVAVVSLALLGIAVSWRQPAVKLFSAIALGGLLYSLGSNDIFQGFIYAVVPFVEKARVPAAAIFLFQAGFAILAAFGVDALRDISDARAEHSRWVRRVNIAVAAFAFITGLTVMAVLIAKKMQWDMDGRIGITVLVAILLSMLLYAWRTRNLTRRQAVTLLTLLFLFEVGNEANLGLADRNDANRNRLLSNAWATGDLADFLHRQPGPFRVESKSNEIGRNWSDFYGVDFPAAFAGVTKNTVLIDIYDIPAQKLLGVKYTLARKATQAGQIEVFRGSSGIAVYQNPDAFPRAWAVHEIVPIRDSAHGDEFVHDYLNQLRSKALSLENPAPTLQACPDAKDNVAVTKYDPSSVALHAEMSCDGMVVLSDTYYPGWYARVDGRPAHIYEVDLALRGVLVPQGAHTVTFHYRPRSVFWGAGITLAGLLAAALLTFAGNRRSRVQPLSHPSPNLPIK